MVKISKVLKSQDNGRRGFLLLRFHFCFDTRWASCVIVGCVVAAQESVSRQRSNFAVDCVLCVHLIPPMFMLLTSSSNSWHELVLFSQAHTQPNSSSSLRVHQKESSSQNAQSRSSLACAWVTPTAGNENVAGSTMTMVADSYRSIRRFDVDRYGEHLVGVSLPAV